MTVDYNDAMQILEDPKAAAWELRDLAKSLLEELQVAKAAERERCIAALKESEWYSCFDIETIIRALGDQP
jgi:uncharacterized membrane-anchored protein